MDSHTGSSSHSHSSDGETAVQRRDNHHDDADDAEAGIAQHEPQQQYQQQQQQQQYQQNNKKKNNQDNNDDAALFRLSRTSKLYDRGNKGYLDETEQQLRQMDTENAGHLSVDKVYQIMVELQREQKSSRQLRQLLAVLAAFSIVLALCNVGTSFAAAKLARDVAVNSNTADLQDVTTHSRVGTTAKTTFVDIDGSTATRRRRSLQTTVTVTDLTVSPATADFIYKELCNGWKGIKTYNGGTVACQSGASSVTLQTCGMDTILQKSSSDPIYFNKNQTVQFTFLAFRDGTQMPDNVLLTCSNTKGKPGTTACTLSGPQLCSHWCRRCDFRQASSFSNWYCPTSQYQFCGCLPGECDVGTFGQPTCTTDCLE